MHYLFIYYGPAHFCRRNLFSSSLATERLKKKKKNPVGQNPEEAVAANQKQNSFLWSVTK